MTQDAIWAIGLMSGTSLDGVDAALLCSDGERIMAMGATAHVPYSPQLQQRLRRLIAGQGDVPALEREITLHHVEAVEKLLLNTDIPRRDIALIGFHGQTLAHRPEEHISWQIGDAALLAARTGIDVIADFRRRDLAEGGQGAPLVPLFHAAMAEALPKPLAVLNIGGVANITYLGSDTLCAFDTGTGNGLLNDWMQLHRAGAFDAGGQTAQQGEVHQHLIDGWLAHPFFAQKPPKSLDRLGFSVEGLDSLSLQDGAATLTAFTAQAIQRGMQHLPDMPERVLVCGGGRHNATMMLHIASLLNVPVEPVEAVGWDGDNLEAQAFAFLAIRSRYGLPLTLPESTGAARAVSGGAFYRA